MKKKSIIGSLLAVFLMMMLPSVSAVESNAVKETTTSRSPFVIPDIDIEELKVVYNNNPSKPLCILITALIWFLKLVRLFLFAFWAVVILFIIKRITNSTTCIIS